MSTKEDINIISSKSHFPVAILKLRYDPSHCHFLITMAILKLRLDPTPVPFLYLRDLLFVSLLNMA